MKHTTDYLWGLNSGVLIFMRMKILNILLALTLFFSAINLHFDHSDINTNVSGTKIYVGSQSTYKTIQEAVDKASPGDTIFVANGTYTENVTIYKPGITLIGNSTTNCNLAHYYVGTDFINGFAAAINITADNVKVTGFNISVAGEYTFGIDVRSATGVNITNNNISSDGSSCYGVNIYFTSSIRVTENTIDTNQSWAHGVVLIYSANNDIINNNISTGSYGYGVYMDTNSNRNNITDNSINATKEYGMGVRLLQSSSNNVTNNTIRCFQKNTIGIYLYTNTNNNRIENNTINTSGSFSYGIWLQSDSVYNNITNNSINTTGQNAHGIYVYDGSSNCNITDNKINITSQNARGIYINYHSDNNYVFNNTIATSNGSTSGIHVQDSIGNEIDRNNINASGTPAAGSAYAIYIHDGSDYNNATNNTIFTFSQQGNGVFIHQNSNYNNVINNSITIFNTSSHGIYLLDNSNNNYITENTVNTSNQGSYGIYVLSDSSYNTVFGNEINTSGDDGIGIYLRSNSNYNNVTHNTIRTTKDSAWGIGAYSNVMNNNITINDINTTGSQARGIYLSDATLTDVIGNHINTTGNGGYGIHLFESNNNFVLNNTINTTNTDGYGIRLDGIATGSSNNFLVNNTINTTGQNANGFSLRFSSNYNNITDNKINNSKMGASGVRIQESSYNNVTDNIINTSGTGGHGIYLNQQCYYNNLTTNTIETGGDNAYGIDVYKSNNNNLTGNTINTTNSGSHGIYLWDNSYFCNLTDNTANTTGVNAAGLKISNSNNTIVSACSFNTTGSGSKGLSFDGMINPVYNATFYNTTLESAKDVDIYVTENGNITMINCSFHDVDVTQSDGGVLQILSYLSIQVYYNDSITPMEWADVEIRDNNVTIYASAGYGGTDENTSAAGRIDTILVNDRWYIKNNNAVENVTNVSVKKTIDRSWEEVRVDVPMNTSRTLTFIADDIIAPEMPTGLSVMRVGTENKINISWNLNADTVNYTVYKFNGTGWEVLENVSHPKNSTLDEDLMDEQLYSYKIEAWDKAGQNSSITSEESLYLTDITPPDTPSGFSVVRNGTNNTLLIYWDPMPDTVNYTVYKFNGTGWEVFENVSHPKNWTIDEDLEDEQYYEYRVQAWDQVGQNSSLSSPQGFYLADITPPETPTGLSIARIGSSNSLNITWNPNNDTINYTIYKFNVTKWDILGNVTHPKTWILDEDLKDNTTYSYKIRAWDKMNFSSDISPQKDFFLADIVPPAKPTGLVVSSQSDGDAFNIDWNPNINDTAKYSIYWGLTPLLDDMEFLINISHPNHYYKFSHPSLVNGTTYYFTIRAWDNVSNPSDYTEPAGEVHRDYLTPAVPKNLKALTYSPSAINLSWDASSDADVVWYRVFVNKTGNTSGGPYRPYTNVKTLTYNITGLVEHTTYYFVVEALDEANNPSGYSGEAQNTTAIEPPGKPVIGQLTEYTNNSNLLITGTAYPGAKIFAFNNNYLTASGTVNSGGTFMITITLIEGANVIKFQAKKYGKVTGDFSDPQTVILDTKKPKANAGPDITINETEIAQFNASGSSDEYDISTYVWTFQIGTQANVTLEGKTAEYRFNIAGEYEVTLTVTDLAGNHGTDTRWVNVTAPEEIKRPSVADTFPKPDNASAAVDTNVTISFDMPMNTASVISVIYVDPFVPYTVDWTADDKIIILIFKENLTYNQTYTISIGNAKGVTGGILIGAPFEFSFTTMKKPEVIQPEPGVTINPVSEPKYLPGQWVIISGTTEGVPEGSIVTIEIRDETAYATVDENGSWSARIRVPDINGDFIIKAEVDGYKQTGRLTVEGPMEPEPEEPEKEDEGLFGMGKLGGVDTFLLLLAVIILIIIILFVLLIRRRAEEVPLGWDKEAKEFECQECGATVQMGDAECEKCGTEFEEGDFEMALAEAAMEFECLKCGGTVKDGEPKCKKCGTKFDEDDFDAAVEVWEKEDFEEEEKPRGKKKEARRKRSFKKDELEDDEEDEDEYDDEDEEEIEESDEEFLVMRTKACPKCGEEIEIMPSDEPRVLLECSECGAKGKIKNPYL